MKTPMMNVKNPLCSAYLLALRQQNNNKKIDAIEQEQ